MNSRIVNKKLKKNILVNLYIKSIIEWKKTIVEFPINSDLSNISVSIMIDMKYFDLKQIYKLTRNIKKRLVTKYILNYLKNNKYYGYTSI